MKGLQILVQSCNKQVLFCCWHAVLLLACSASEAGTDRIVFTRRDLPHVTDKITMYLLHAHDIHCCAGHVHMAAHSLVCFAGRGPVILLKPPWVSWLEMMHWSSTSTSDKAVYMCKLSAAANICYATMGIIPAIDTSAIEKLHQQFSSHLQAIQMHKLGRPPESV